MGGQWADGNSKKETKGNVRNGKTDKKNAFGELISRLNLTKERIITMKTGQYKLSRLKCKEEKKKKVK